VSRSVAFVYDHALVDYDFGPAHPLNPVRVELTMALADTLGVLGLPAMAKVPFTSANDDLLMSIHSPEYIAAVRAAGRSLLPDDAHGLGTADNPVFADMHEAAAAIAGATVAAAEAVWIGRAEHALNVAGGLHHAMKSSASGFCVYNDPAIAIAWLLEHGASRIAYVDIDVHHGDGVQAAFWDDPRVLTISIHESGRTLFPGTGFPYEIGGPAARGYAVNVALPAGTGDDGWLRALKAVAAPLVRAFRPDILVSQHGCDSHALDPLANLTVSLDGQRTAHATLHDLAHEVAGGRWLATGGGGYELVRVVPRSWTHLLAEAAGQPVEPERETPAEWREFALGRTSTHAPLTMTDGRSARFRPYDASHERDSVDEAIRLTRRNVFEVHGLDPMAAQ
jgi:acetoin utilization protein AcuC